jgi:hypothetical protein
LQSLHQQPLLNQRCEQITERCNYVLEQHGISKNETRKFVRAMAKWFWSEKRTPKGSDDGPDFTPPYTRPVSNTIWDERFDLTTSIVSLPVTKEFLEFIGSKSELPKHWLYAYIAALALLDILDGLLGTRPEDLEAFEKFSGPHEEGSPDYTAIDTPDERNTMIENMLGKAEEFIFKADAFEEAANKGAEGSPPTDLRWETPVLEYLQTNKKTVEGFRKPSGKINRNGLAKHLVQELQAKRGIKLPKSDRTIVDRLKKLLPEAGILEMGA